MAKSKAMPAFRGFFRTVSGADVALDFYADNRGLAYDHAYMLAADVRQHPDFGPLTLVKVKRLHADDVFDAGSFYPVR